MSEKITYTVLADHARRIRDLVVMDKFRNPDDFIDTAIRILLTWESKHPEECIEIMKRLMPFSPEQDAFMKMSMKPEERTKYFGQAEIGQDFDEISLQKIKAQTGDDYLKLQNNLENAKDYIKNLKIKTPENIIPYDGFPLLFSYYTRFLPVKIAICVLGDLLQQKNDWKVELKEWRVIGYDIAEEIAKNLVAYEKENDIARNKKISTGLPKKGKKDKDEEKIAMAQKRFKEHFIGKIRGSRTTKEDHFEGAPAALGLVYALEEDGKEYVTLTEKGKKLFLLDNPVVRAEYDKGPLTKDESDFILNELIPQLNLEKKFVDTAISVIKRISHITGEEKNKITYVLDVEFHNAVRKFNSENPAIAKLHKLNNLDTFNSATHKKISSWRVATMGRLAELQKVDWKIDEKGDSEFILN